MKTIKNSKDITTLEVGDKVVFGNLEYVVDKDFKHNSTYYYLYCPTRYNGTIFEILNFRKKDFVEKLGINADCYCDFPETKSLEALTAIVSALFKEYEKQNQLPKTWEEFCEKYFLQDEEVFITSSGRLLTVAESFGRKFRISDEDKNIYTSKQEAEAFLALMQLRQLRKAYVKDWEPDWTDCRKSKFSITCIEGVLSIFDTVTVHRSMSFPTRELAKQFLNNFNDLLEIAKPLL